MTRQFKFTLVQNPFNRPIEEVLMTASAIPNMFERYGLIGALTVNGDAYTYDEYTGTEPLGPENISPSEPFWVNEDEYDYTNIDLSTSPKGWLAFYETHTRVRKSLYHIFMRLLKYYNEGTMRFYSVTFIKTECNKYIGVSQRELPLQVGSVKIPKSIKGDICHRITGGGGGCESHTVCPIPPMIDLYKLFVYIRKNANVRRFIKCIITSNNYYYGFDDSTDVNIIRGTGPIITPILEEFPFNMLVIDNYVVSKDEPHRHAKVGGQQIIPQIAARFNASILYKVIRRPMRLYNTYTTPRFTSGWVHLYDLADESVEEEEEEVDPDFVQVGLPYKSIRIIHREKGEEFIM